MSQAKTCKAAWSGGKCDNEPNAARGLCQGHYAQWRRATGAGKADVAVSYTPLRAGNGPTTAPLTVHLPRDVKEAYQRAAEDAGKGVTELLRPWLAEGFKRHQARQERRKQPPPV